MLAEQTYADRTSMTLIFGGVLHSMTGQLACYKRWVMCFDVCPTGRQTGWTEKAWLKFRQRTSGILAKAMDLIEPQSFLAINPRPDGPLDFPPHHGGGGVLRTPLVTRLLDVVAKNRKARLKALQKLLRKCFRHFPSILRSPEVTKGQIKRNSIFLEMYHYHTKHSS